MPRSCSYSQICGYHILKYVLNAWSTRTLLDDVFELINMPCYEWKDKFLMHNVSLCISTQGSLMF